jgi:hypothetical protein
MSCRGCRGQDVGSFSLNGAWCWRSKDVKCPSFLHWKSHRKRR